MTMLEELTLKEQKALEEFQKRLIGCVPLHLKNDMYLYLRFLRARDFNLSAAEDMLKKHFEWRRTYGIDTILTDFVPAEVDPRKALDSYSSSTTPLEKRKARMGVVIKYLPLTRIGFDKKGAPIRYFAFGDMDAKGILKSVQRNECIKAVIQCFEEDVAVMKKQSEKLGNPVEQWTYIFNFENYSFAKATHKPTLETLIALFMQYEANYPERLKAAYIINASIYFSIMFSIIKPLLSGATTKKITIFGKEGWKEELLKNIDPEVLPVFLGGTRTDSNRDPMCKCFIKHGQLVPEEYYLEQSANRLKKQPGVQKVTVARMAKVNLNLDVDKPGSLIEWEFATVGKDIGFGILYKNSTCDDITKELVPSQRIDTQMVSEAGMYQCESPGTYILVFDNTYSWMYQKEIYYKASVVNPKVLNNQS